VIPNPFDNPREIVEHQRDRLLRLSFGREEVHSLPEGERVFNSIVERKEEDLFDYGEKIRRCLNKWIDGELKIFARNASRERIELRRQSRTSIRSENLRERRDEQDERNECSYENTASQLFQRTRLNLNRS
jgi:hypothetical protein